jgi:hypothetical protein
MCPSIATYLSICCSFNDLTNILKSNSVAYNVKMAKIIISSQCNMFSPWYNWTVANLLLNKNHWLTELWEYTLSSICNFQVVSDHDYLSINKLKLWVRIPRGVLDTKVCDKVCHCLAVGRWFSVGTPDSYINKAYRRDIVEILWKYIVNDLMYYWHLIYWWTSSQITTLVVIGTDCTGSFKSNYHTITTTTALK